MVNAGTGVDGNLRSRDAASECGEEAGRLFFNTVVEMDEYPYTDCEKSRPNYLRQEWMT